MLGTAIWPAALFVAGNLAAAQPFIAARGFDADFADISKAISGRDVFGLRRRVFDCSFRKAGAGRVSSDGACHKIVLNGQQLLNYVTD